MLGRTIDRSWRSASGARKFQPSFHGVERDGDEEICQDRSQRADIRNMLSTRPTCRGRRLYIAASIFLVLLAPRAALAAISDSTTGALTGTIIRPILATANQGLQFGVIVRPTSGSGVATLSNAGALSVTGTGAIALPSSVSRAAMFTISGEGGQTFTLTIDSTVTLTNAAPSGGTLTVSTTNDAGCAASCTLSGVVGNTASGTLIFHVGGTFPISSAAHTGTYSGTINVLVTYN